MNLKEKHCLELDPDYPKKKILLANLLNRLDSLPEPNRSTVFGFHEGYSIKQGNQIGTQIKNLYVLRRIVEDFGVNLSKLSVQDLIKIRVSWAKTKSPHALSRDMLVLRAVIKYTGQKRLLTNENLKTPRPYSTIEGKLREEQIPRQEEIAQLLSFLPLKYRAIVACLYGGGLRVSAARFLKRDNAEWEPDSGVSLSFVSKGSINKVWIREDLSKIIREWFNSSPYKKPTDFAFPGPHGNPLTIAAIDKEINRATIKAGWPSTRKTNPHIFRHAAVLELQRAGVSEHFIKQRFWNNQQTEMASKAYMHLNTEDTNKAIKKFYGQKIAEKPPIDPFKQKTCFSCGQSWPFDQSICSCGTSLENPEKVFAKNQDLEAKLGAMQEQMKMMQTVLAQVSQKIKP